MNKAYRDNKYFCEDMLSCSYSKALCKYLGSMEERDSPEIREKDSLFMTNLVQGIILRELTHKICESYEAEDLAIKNRLTQIVMNHLSKSLFQDFREKIRADSGLIREACKKVIKYAYLSSHANVSKENLEKYFSEMVKKYFLSRDIGKFSEWLSSDPEIRCEILLYKLKTHIKNPVEIDTFETALKDCDSYDLIVFERYAQKTRFHRILQMLKNEEFRVETDFLKRRDQNSKKGVSYRESKIRAAL